MEVMIIIDPIPDSLALGFASFGDTVLYIICSIPLRNPNPRPCRVSGVYRPVRIS